VDQLAAARMPARSMRSRRWTANRAGSPRRQPVQVVLHFVVGGACRVAGQAPAWPAGLAQGLEVAAGIVAVGGAEGAAVARAEARRRQRHPDVSAKAVAIAAIAAASLLDQAVAPQRPEY
jgi:hypothetical protein